MAGDCTLEESETRDPHAGTLYDYEAESLCAYSDRVQCYLVILVSLRAVIFIRQVLSGQE